MDSRILVGAEVNVESTNVPGFDNFMVHGKVTRSREVVESGYVKWEHGIQFTKVDDETRRILHGLAQYGDMV